MASKNLFYTKSAYESILKEAHQRIEEKNRKGIKHPNESGLYYEAFIGYIRSGVLHSRETGEDGTPQLQVLIDGSPYRCPEAVVKDLLGTDAEMVIEPYEDNSASYYKPGRIEKFVLDLEGNPVVASDGEIIAAEELKKNSAGKVRKEKTKKEDEDIPDFDPDYDHYYDEALPDILSKVDEIRSDGTVQGLISIACLVNIAILLLFVF